MEPRRNPIRRAALVGVAVLLVFGASACSGGSGVVGHSPAATVNGTDISRDTLDQSIESTSWFEKEGQAQQAQLDQQGQDSTQLQAQVKALLDAYVNTNSTIPARGAAFQLTDLIRRQVFEDAAAEAGIEITDDHRTQAEENLKQQYLTFADAPDDVREREIASEAAQIALQASVPKDLTDAVTEAGQKYEAQLRALYDQQEDAFVQVCLLAIATNDQQSAQAAVDRVKGGEDFAAVAADVSLADPAAATTPNCAPVSQIATAFGDAGANAKAGDVLGPVDSGQGWVLFEVASVEPQPFEQVRETLAQAQPDQFTPEANAAVNAYILRVLGRASDVDVDPRFGTWNAQALRVDPPAAPIDPGATTTTIPTTGLPTP